MEIRARGVKAKMFIPCIEGRCPGRMQLIVRDGQRRELAQPYYRCMRDELPNPCRWSEDDRARAECRPGVDIFVERWVRSDDDTKRLKDGDVPTREDMETMI